MAVAGPGRGPDGLERDGATGAAVVAPAGDGGATLAAGGVRLGGRVLQPP